VKVQPKHSHKRLREHDSTGVSDGWKKQYQGRSRKQSWSTKADLEKWETREGNLICTSKEWRCWQCGGSEPTKSDASVVKVQELI
jgi:hypothetical protein